MQGKAAPLKHALERARHLYVQRVSGYPPPAEPFLEPQGLEWLRRQLASSKLFLEFGSGGSTVLANSLSVRSVSVESDPFYAAVVRRSLCNPDLATVVTPAMGLTVEWGMPLVGRRRKGLRYIKAPFQLLPRAPDLVLVDGRYRVASALESAKRLHELGCHAAMFFDDYFDRPFYRSVEDYLSEPTMIGRAAIFDLGERPVPEEAIRFFAKDPR